jgi:5-methylcytosine-specific restriction endonuclease McrA
VIRRHENMQKLEKRDTYTPTDTPLVRSNCDPVLKVPRGKDGVQDSKTSSNNSEVDQRSGKSGQNLRVFVLNMRGAPLMPMTPGKARKLLKEGKAKVVQRTPFTIQLLYATGETKQDVTLGVDAGYSTVGYSATTDEKELIAGELTLRSDIKRLLEKRRAYRRTRRSRKWHREPRFNNRGKKGWFAPSIRHKLDSHIRLIEKIKKLLPITKTVIEVASFDTQKMQNPEISGIEYQHGELQGYEVREYLLEKFNRKCAYCGKKDTPLEVEHIVPKSRGGSDRISNLTIACHECNQTKGSQTAEEFGHPKIQAKADKSLKATAFMNYVRSRIVDLLNCDSTYGYITKHDRIELGLPKSHANDAFVIAGGDVQQRSEEYIVTQTRRNKRSIQMNRRGYRPSIRRQRYKLQPNDLVKHEGLLCVVKGVHSYGRYVKLVDHVGNLINSNIKNVEMVKHGKGIQFA